MFVSPAYAQAGGGVGTDPGFIFVMIAMFAIFYFLLIRPQQKKMKQHKAMLASVRRGDKIVTGGGIIGTVTKVIDDNEVVVEISEGVKVRVQRGLISMVLTKTEPVNDDVKGGGKPSGKGKDDEGGGGGGAASTLKKLLGGKNNS